MKISLLILNIFLFVLSANAQWTIKHLVDKSYYTGTIKFKNDSLGLFMGNGSTILKTINLGNTWDSIPLNFSININNFQFIGDSCILAVGDNKLIKSENLGENWDSTTNLIGKQLRSLWFFNIDSGFVAGFDGIYKTINSGNTLDTVWSVGQSGYKYGEVRQIFFPTANIGYAIGVGRNQSNNPSFVNFLIKTTDSGITWNSIKTFSNSSLTSIYFVNQNVGFIIDESGNIFKTTDAGNTWTEKQISNTRIVVKSIQFLSDTLGFATGGVTNVIVSSGGGSNFFISKTVDGGENWTSYDTIGIELNSIFFINDTTGFVSGKHELIMKCDGQINKLPENYPWYLTESVGIDDHKLQNANFNVYPNPTTKILYIQQTTKNIESIYLINTYGQIVKSRKNEANNEIIELNLSDLIPGIYMLRIESDDKSMYMKIIKE